jgi:hypothetical protein
MALSRHLPRLELLPTESIRFHERAERGRTLKLVERIRTDAFLRNPPIVAGMGAGEYLLLDGANRVSAFRELALPAFSARTACWTFPVITITTMPCRFMTPTCYSGTARPATKNGTPSS